MKVLGISGSPRKEGNTVYLMKLLLEKIEKEYESEIIYLRDLDIEPCRECYSCVENNVCVIKDAMQTLYQKLKETDVLILASPVFMGGVTSRMRAFMERTWSLRKGKLKGKVGSYVIVGRRDIGSALNEFEAYLSRLKLYKVPGVLGFAFRRNEILEDVEALTNVKRVAKQILQLKEK